MLGKIRNKLRFHATAAERIEEAHERLGAAHAEVAALRNRLAETGRKLSERDRELSETRKKLEGGSSGTKPEARSASPLPADTPPPFFIVGPPKSGTTWLAATLGSHPEIFCAGEAKFFGRDFRTENPYGQWGAEVSEAMTGSHEIADRASLHGALADSHDLKRWFDANGEWTVREDTDRHIRAFVRLGMDYVFASALAGSGKRIVGDKSPSHVQYLEEMAEFYPEAKVIHIIRDGRDQAVSSVFHWWRKARDLGGFFPLSESHTERREAYYGDRNAFGPDKRSIFDEASVRAFARQWREAVENARENGPRLFGERYFEVKYEELQKEPERLFGEMARLLGASSDEKLISEIVDKNSFESKSKRSVGSEDPKSFLRSGKAGGWKDHFTGRDRKIYEEEAGELLAKLGYGTDDSR